ncbi:hypothetical protein LIPSTDRAFT_224783 [Lipomyces starkeyi NRRL Y-11557]|uniref:Zn(2)-C6 fungal-type domain-containing protein n=1 Tax=Lipomyces starkeyi NRRL Y-11557 TaxID=675824 RepID=A0A1E3PU01_LIPST|nr:hypothetical protein LIPSTDRAFT_224783 [Lipomyces starkeyi NRRL Y-11557]
METNRGLDPPILRTPLACVRCRERKIKCDGKVPCASCMRHLAPCNPGVRSRRRGRPRATPEAEVRLRMTPEAEQTSHSTKVDSVNSSTANPVYHQVLHSVTRTDTSTSSPMHLCYGASSNFSFLQQLYNLIKESEVFRGQIISPSGESISHDAINAFGYRELFFGTTPHESTAPPSTPITDRNRLGFRPAFLPPKLASDFLDAYLSVTHHILPFCNSKTLRDSLRDLSNIWVGPSQSLDFALILVVLAIGALLRNHMTWANLLYNWAETGLGSLNDIVNLRAVQVLMLMAEFQAICGRPNAAYMISGNACRMALAGGLHRHVLSRSYEPGSEHETDTREREFTFWCLYSYEKSSCLFFGRPTSFADCDIDVPYPTGNSFLRAFVTLSKISHRVHREVYAPQSCSVAKLWEIIQSISGELAEFHRGLEETQKFPLTSDDLHDPKLSLTIEQVILAFQYFHTLILSYRPCLIIDSICRRKASTTSPKTRDDETQHTRWLEEVCCRCRQVASHSIYLFSKALETLPLICHMKFSGFFIEGACMALLFDIFRVPSQRSECEKSIMAINTGLRCFFCLPEEGPRLISSRAVQKLVHIARLAVMEVKGEISGPERTDCLLSPLESHIDFLNGTSQLSGNASSKRYSNNEQSALPRIVDDISSGIESPANEESTNAPYPYTADLTAELNIADANFYLWTNWVAGANHDAAL